MAQLNHISLSDIQPDPEQPRKDFDQEALQDLANSIAARGVIQAITVRLTPPNLSGPQYMIIAGERRWRASAIAGQETIPAVLKEDYETDADAIRAEQLTENLFREDLNPVEKAEFIQTRIDELKNQNIPDAVSQVAQELGVTASWVSKNTAILKVSEDIRSLARVGKIRDYSIVKKLDKLKGHKRTEAISQIETNSFNSKDFFKRKRYDKPSTDNNDNVSEVAVKKQQRPKPISFNPDEVIALIGKTDYRYVLSESDPNWTSNLALLPEYFKKFKEWAIAPNDDI